MFLGMCLVLPLERRSGWERFCATISISPFTEVVAECTFETGVWKSLPLFESVLSDSNCIKLLSLNVHQCSSFSQEENESRGDLLTSHRREGGWDDWSYREKKFFCKADWKNQMAIQEVLTPSSCIQKIHPSLVQVVYFALLTRIACWFQSAKFYLPMIATDLELFFFFFCFKFGVCCSMAW